MIVKYLKIGTLKGTYIDMESYKSLRHEKRAIEILTKLKRGLFIYILIKIRAIPISGRPEKWAIWAKHQ